MPAGVNDPSARASTTYEPLYGGDDKIDLPLLLVFGVTPAAMAALIAPRRASGNDDIFMSVQTTLTN